MNKYDVSDIESGYKNKKIKNHSKRFNYFVRLYTLITKEQLFNSLNKYRIDLLIYKTINNTTMFLIVTRDVIYWKNFPFRNQYNSLDKKFRSDHQVCDNLRLDVQCSGVVLINEMSDNESDDDNKNNLPF